MAEATAQLADLDEQREAITERKRIENARAWLKDFFRREGLDKTALAKRLGLGKEYRNVVSKFFSDDDASDVNFTRLILAAERLRAQVEGPEGVAKWLGFQKTRCSEAVWKHASAARDGHRLAAIVGPIGAGKSEALREFQRMSRQDGKAPVRLIRCRTTMNLQSLVRKLAVDMGLVESGGEMSTLHEQIVRRLSGYPEFLIFDEVDYLMPTERCFHFLRDLYDETGTGILLSGQLYFLSYLWQRADFAAAAKPGDLSLPLAKSGSLAPFADRLAVQVAPGLDEEEVVDIAEQALNATLTEEASSKLVFYVDHNFRVLCDVLSKMREMRIKGGRSIDHRMVEAAWVKTQHIKAKQ